MSDTKKDFITDCIIGMAKISFRVVFLRWFTNHRLDLSVKEDFLKHKQFLESVEQSIQVQTDFIDFIANIDYKKAKVLKATVSERGKQIQMLMRRDSVIAEKAKDLDMLMDLHKAKGSPLGSS